MKKVKLLAASALMSLSFISMGALADTPAVDTYYFDYHAVPYEPNLLTYTVDIEGGANTGYPTHFDMKAGVGDQMLQTPADGQLTFKFNAYTINNPQNPVDTCDAVVQAGQVVSSSCTSGNLISDDMNISGVDKQVYSVNLLNASNI